MAETKSDSSPAQQTSLDTLRTQFLLRHRGLIRQTKPAEAAASVKVSPIDFSRLVFSPNLLSSILQSLPQVPSSAPLPEVQPAPPRVEEPTPPVRRVYPLPLSSSGLTKRQRDEAAYIAGLSPEARVQRRGYLNPVTPGSIGIGQDRIWNPMGGPQPGAVHIYNPMSPMSGGVQIRSPFGGPQPGAVNPGPPSFGGR